MIHRRGKEAGSAVVELVLWAPVLALLLMLVVAAGRIVQADGQAGGAARDAARAASLHRDLASATAAAQQAAAASLAGDGITCRGVDVRVTGSVAPGGAVTVEVACTASLADLALPGAPGSKTLRARCTAPVEATRGTALGARSADGGGEAR